MSRSVSRDEDVIVSVVVRRDNLAGLIAGVPVIHVRLEPTDRPDVYSLGVTGFEDDLPIALVGWKPEGFTSPLREVVRGALEASAGAPVDEQAEKVVRAIRALLAEEEADEPA